MVKIRIVVVFPAPFGPSNPKTVPSSTARSTPLTAFTVPNDFVRPSVEMIEFAMRARISTADDSDMSAGRGPVPVASEQGSAAGGASQARR